MEVIATFKRKIKFSLKFWSVPNQFKREYLYIWREVSQHGDYQQSKISVFFYSLNVFEVEGEGTVTDLVPSGWLQIYSDLSDVEIPLVVEFPFRQAYGTDSRLYGNLQVLNFRVQLW